ncbi:hypothetical protein KRP22_006139 [Phytophthora ramorum]|nr:bZIP transcription factor 1 [Phytophthora ramorum]KAH7507634.1 bZIP transcription factor 1 [Phytophthora ramorum]
MSALVPLSQFFAESQSSVSPAGMEAPTTPSPVQAKPKRKRIRLKTQRRQEQCRNNQARYRDRQRGVVQELEASVDELRKEIQKLTIERRTLCYGIKTKANVWNVVVEYFRLLRYGFLMPMHGAEPSRATETPLAADLHEQEYFLRAVMATDVAFGELSGVDVLIEQWQRYSSYFGSLQLHLNRMEQQPCGGMATSASLSLTITQNTLRYVFPHLLHDNSPICSRLLGQRLHCRCSVRFLWDDSAGCVARLDCTMDLLSPLLRTLGNLEDVNYVLEEALITPSHLIGETKFYISQSKKV